MAGQSIDIDVSPRKTIPLNFGKDKYQILPPKGALSLDLAQRASALKERGDAVEMWDEIAAWFRDGLGDEQWERIDKRLHDPEDGLDIGHLVTAMEKLIEVVTDSPTTSSPD